MVANSETGQSILEFLFMVPMLVGFTFILVKVNTAIQISIVDQQYARAHTLFLTFNSPFYPKKKLQTALKETGNHFLLLGVSDNPAGNIEASYQPKATVQSVVVSNSVKGDHSPVSEPKRRSSVRIRNTVTLCTQNYYIKIGQGKITPIFDGTQYHLTENSSVNLYKNICAGKLAYEQ